MSQTAQGIVFRVFEKKYRDKMLYSLKFDGQDNYYRMNENRFSGKIEAGFELKIGYTTDQNGNHVLIPEQIKTISTSGAAPEPGKSSSGGGGSAPASGGGTSTQQAIQYQSSRKDALEFVRIIADNEVVKLPAKTKPDERLAALEALVDRYTARFFLDIDAQGAIQRSDSELHNESEVPADAPAAATDDWDGDADKGDSDDWD